MLHWTQIPQRTNATTKLSSIKSVCYYEHRCYNEQFLSIKSGWYYERRCYNERMLQRTVFINKIRMLHWTQILQRKNATTNSFINKIRILQRTQILQRTFCINKIRMLQRTQMLQHNECSNEEFLSIKSGCYIEHRYYNERAGILSVDIACRLLTLFMWVRLFMLFKFACTLYRS